MQFLRILLGILREIGDETAYSRYCTLHSVPPSRTAWREFSEARLKAKYARAKCC